MGETSAQARTREEILAVFAICWLAVRKFILQKFDSKLGLTSASAVWTLPFIQYV